MKRTRMMPISMAVLFFSLASLMPLASLANDTTGKLHGFVYGIDGKKPLPDAIVLMRETSTLRIYPSEKTRKNGAYVIENVLPGTYAVGIQWDGNEYNIDVLVRIEPKKQMACFTLPRKTEKPGYQVRCKDPACFFITPCGWAVVAGATAGIALGVIKIVEKEASPTRI